MKKKWLCLKEFTIMFGRTKSEAHEAKTATVALTELQEKRNKKQEFIKIQKEVKNYFKRLKKGKNTILLKPINDDFSKNGCRTVYKKKKMKQSSLNLTSEPLTCA